jgi:hypothetical protein
LVIASHKSFLENEFVIVAAFRAPYLDAKWILVARVNYESEDRATVEELSGLLEEEDSLRSSDGAAVDRGVGRHRGADSCNLCIHEKVKIMFGGSNRNGTK